LNLHHCGFGRPHHHFLGYPGAAAKATAAEAVPRALRHAGRVPWRTSGGGHVPQNSA